MQKAIQNNGYYAGNYAMKEQCYKMLQKKDDILKAQMISISFSISVIYLAILQTMPRLGKASTSDTFLALSGNLEEQYTQNRKCTKTSLSLKL